MRLPRPTYANVMSTVAVFIALGGTSYAVTKLPKGAVGERELKRNAVTGDKVKDGSLSAADLAGGLASGSGARGPRGAEGPAGPAGPAGANGRDLAAAEAWKPLPLAKNWVQYTQIAGGGWRDASYRKDGNGVVNLRGMISWIGDDPTQLTAGTIVSQLPPGYHPQRNELFSLHSGDSTQRDARFDIWPDGTLRWYGGATGRPNAYSLSGLSWSID